MPSGRVHDTLNTLAYAGLAGAALYAYSAGLIVVEPLAALVFSSGYFAGTFLLSPDLDLAEGHVSSKRSWGLLGFLWVPYGWLMRHRGMSHSWVLGPLTRLLYLGLLVMPPLALLKVSLPRPEALELAVVAWLLGGYYLSQWFHLVADGVFPDLDPGGLPVWGRRRRPR